MLKRKVAIGILTMGLTIGALGTVALAQDPAPNQRGFHPMWDNGFQQMWENGVPNFDEMLPFMQEIHPNLTDEQLEDMYNACHGEDGNGGMMRGAGFGPRQTNMMYNF